VCAHVQAPTELIAQPDVVMLDLAVNSREAALRKLHGALAANPAVRDGERFLRDVLERVMLASVCIAPEVALPHARTDAVNRMVLAIGRMAAPGVGFDAEHPHIRLVFLIGTPRAEVNNYLRLVARISRLLKTGGIHEALLAAPDEPAFRAILARAAAQ
jgi:Phosphotransferase system mannitol/fructose-specific IIA domain (Ntr-type)